MFWGGGAGSPAEGRRPLCGTPGLAVLGTEMEDSHSRKGRNLLSSSGELSLRVPRALGPASGSWVLGGGGGGLQPTVDFEAVDFGDVVKHLQSLSPRLQER